MKKAFLLICIICSLHLIGQKNVFTFGLQYKPIIPSDIMGTGSSQLSSDSITFNTSLSPKFGNVFGGVFRYGFTNWFSLESGINFTQRNYEIKYNIPDSNWTGLTNDLRVISYEIPLNALFFIRLSKQLYMNTAVGLSMTIFPSNVQTSKEFEEYDIYVEQEGRRRSAIQGAFNANVGFEWRTKKSGFFYLGTSFHMPLVPIMNIYTGYVHQSGPQGKLVGNIYGSYLTLDLRYFFHEDPETKKQRKASTKIKREEFR
jgi:hypothetical protein